MLCKYGTLTKPLQWQTFGLDVRSLKCNCWHCTAVHCSCTVAVGEKMVASSQHPISSAAACLEPTERSIPALDAYFPTYAGKHARPAWAYWEADLYTWFDYFVCIVLPLICYTFGLSRVLCSFCLLPFSLLIPSTPVQNTHSIYSRSVCQWSTKTVGYDSTILP
jgi:hypothetical protein